MIMDNGGPRQSRDLPHHCVSAPIDLEGRPARLLVNAEGIGDLASLTAKVLAESFAPLPGYTAGQCVAATPGLRAPVRWQERERIEAPAGRIRLRLVLSGVRPEDARLYAAYLGRG